MEKAFTLVELAIVLIIIGLITGGVVGTNSLIEGSKRQKVITQFKGWNTAINAFQLEYNYLPGDLPSSWDYFDFSEYSSAYGQSNSHSHWTRGDKIISATAESSMAFIEMEKSGILPDLVRHNNESGVAEYYSKCGLNAPSGPYGNTCWQLTSTLHDYEQSNTQDYLVLGAEREDGTWLQYIEAASMKPADVKSIDKKIDDGQAGLGVVTGWRAQGMAGSWISDIMSKYSLSTGQNICKNGSSGNIYGLEQNEPTCYIAFRLD